MEYKELYNQLLTSPSSVLGDSVDERDKVVATINRFFDEYPKNIKTTDPDSQLWVDVPIRQLTKKSIETMVDIINDISVLLSQRQQYSAAEFRRNIVNVFLQPDRRVYVGLWLIVISFILYFIDSAA